MSTEEQKEQYQEMLEDYKEKLSRYCYAAADLSIKKNEDGYYMIEQLKDCLYIMGGHFDSDYVAKEIMLGDFPFDEVDSEGIWHFDFLLKYIRGDHEEPDYMELLLTEAKFCISFEDKEIQDKELENFKLPF